MEMKPVFTEELIGFFGMFLLGIALGIIFDFFKGLRLKIIKEKALVHLSDILFWIIAIIFSTYVLYFTASGSLRVFYIVSTFLGLILYFLFFSKWILKVFCIVDEIILKIFRFIFKIILTPLAFLYKILLIGLKKIFKILKRFIPCRKKKKRGNTDGRKETKEQKNFHTDPSGYFGGCFLFSKRNNVATRNNKKQRKNRKSKKSDSRAGTKTEGFRTARTRGRHRRIYREGRKGKTRTDKGK